LDSILNVEVADAQSVARFNPLQSVGS
jgi:hypothetical protein